jgi:hypothetical protein
MLYVGKLILYINVEVCYSEFHGFRLKLQDDLTTFEAAWTVLKIGLSLKLIHHKQI